MKKIIFTLLVSALSLTACKQEAPKSATQNSTTTSTATSSSSSSMPSQIKDSAGKFVGGFDLSDLKIQSGEKIFEPKEKEDKRKYFTDGMLTYEVKTKDDAFKLRDASSNLLWKVKMYPDKIKISDNEENSNPFEIKNNGGVIEISKNDQKVATAEVKDDKILVNGKETYSLFGANNSYAMGILAIDQIPMEQRIFLLAEYLYRTK